MNRTHKSFKQPEDSNISVWRYIDLPKLIHLLEKKALYLTRIDRFEDKNEGSIPRANYLDRKEAFERLPTKFNVEKILQREGKLFRLHPCMMYANCWSMSKEDSPAMWRIYSYNNQSIAIQTTYEKLSICNNDNQTIHIGMMNYIDYNKDHMSLDNFLNNCMHKNHSFQHENEIRILYWDTTLLEKDSDILKTLDIEKIKKNMPIEHLVPVDLERLIEKIYVNPYADKSYFEIIELIIKKYLPSKEVKWSNFKTETWF